MRFVLDGCDISFIAEAPEDITLKQLLKQTDRIIPNWCACGIRSLDKYEYEWPVDLVISYDDITKLGGECEIKEVENNV